ncbi:hypothetical protein BU202_06965 [Streptococcus cuniculi]|uniref:Transcriptional regulator n=1 Tax=Streptococcus cuniculi TaxID=1432788 RepID=A0A1Q8E7K3_9STRE|nr:PAS domain-containing protein [Streptococcus cuniculi]OLF47763.1 hypothetical protein BU202_06965 [Streptococcus cuniculi]
MNPQLKSYIPIIDFLSLILGNDTEIVLQDFTKGLDHSLVYIKNNLSEREIGAPATDFVLDVLKSKLYKEKDYVVNYHTKTVSGRELYSSSFFIKNEQEQLLGMLCINSDKSKLLSLKRLFESSLETIDSLFQTEETNSSTKDITENFYSTPENLIEATILQETQGLSLGTYNLTKNEKIAIVRSLYQKGFFELKDSVSKIAETFRMSDVSIYKYIQTVRQEKQD